MDTRPDSLESSLIANHQAHNGLYVRLTYGSKPRGLVLVGARSRADLDLALSEWQRTGSRGPKSWQVAGISNLSHLPDRFQRFSSCLKMFKGDLMVCHKDLMFIADVVVLKGNGV